MVIPDHVVTALAHQPLAKKRLMNLQTPTVAVAADVDVDAIVAAIVAAIVIV